MRAEEDPILEKMEKTSKKSKKNKTSNFQEVASNIATDDYSDEVVDRKGYVEVDGYPQNKKGQKQKKKKKSKSSEGFDMYASSTEVMVGAKLSEEDKKKRKNKKNDHGGEFVVDRLHDEAHEKGSLEVDDEVQKDKDQKQKKQKSNKCSEEVITEMRNSEEFTKSKKTTRREKDDKDRDSKGEKKIEDVESRAFCDAGTVEKMEKKKWKREKKKENNGLDAGSQETVTEESVKEGSVLPEKDFVDGESDGPLTLSKTKDGEEKEGRKGKKKKKKMKKAIAAENSSEDPQPKRKSKKVSFSNDVEVFPSVVRGKRFSQEEDKILKEAVLNYIEAHGLGEEGLNMVMHCKSHTEIKNCWKEIGAAIPYRPVSACYYRAHILFERGATRKWTEEDYEFVRKAQQERGNDWKSIAEELGKHRFHVKDTWRRIKFVNRKKGHWSQEEYQTLYDLVNMDLKMKLDAEEKKSKHGMLRDNVPWSAISETLSTRSDALCCLKWYKQLTSSMVADGLWADADDYRLVGALYDLDACCEGDVDWDNLLGHRSGDVCRKRWNQMVLHIGHHGSKPFAEQVETLAQRYCPDLAETREAWDSKPVTP